MRFGRSGAAFRFRFLFGIGLPEKRPRDQREHRNGAEANVDVVEIALPPRAGGVHSHWDHASALRHTGGMSEPGLIITRTNSIVTITLNQPAKKNAVNQAMWLGLLETFRGLRQDRDARVVIITGAGDGFCSGADVSAFLEEDSNESSQTNDRPHPLMAMRQTKDVALALHELPMPTIAKVNGVAAGAGCNIALGCDLIIASDRARFSEIFPRRALSLDFGGSWVLPRLIGIHRAKELAFFGDILSAQEAADLGLVNRVVAHDELDVTVDSWAKRLAAGPPLALTQTKSMLNKSMGLSMEEALDVEAAAQAINLSTNDNREAAVAFFEKREAIFEGR